MTMDHYCTLKTTTTTTLNSYHYNVRKPRLFVLNFDGSLGFQDTFYRKKREKINR